jgi:hypothetical protein
MRQHEHRYDHDPRSSSDTGTSVSPGKVTLTSRLQRSATSAPPPEGEHAASSPDRDALHALQDQGLAHAMGFFDEPLRTVQRAPVQLSTDTHTGLDDTEVQAVAARGTAGPGGSLPHLDAIQRSFGPHDVSGVTAHVGGAAAEASAALGAHAYATGDHVAFASAPSLALAAHEAAHVVQQRAGVHLSAAVGQAGDAYEQHADAVAARVVAGESAADLLGAVGGAGVQRAAIQRDVHWYSRKDVRARVQDTTVVGDKIQVQLSVGSAQGVFDGTPGYLEDPNGVAYRFNVFHVMETSARALIGASLDYVRAHPIAVLNPSKEH